MSGAAVPSSLLDPELVELWQRARQRLDRFGPDRRGTIGYPASLGPSADRAVRTLLDRRRVPQRLDLVELEQALVRLGIGPDLDAALSALGHPPSVAAADQRRHRHQTSTLRTALAREVGTWPEPWAEQWLGELISAGLAGGVGLDLVTDVRRLLDALADPVTRARLGPDRAGLLSRSDLAALVFGSAHALDTGTSRQRAALRALALTQGASSDDPRTIWARAGFHLDTVSAPVLTWALDRALDPDRAPHLHQVTAVATGIGAPLHLTTALLEQHPAVARSSRGGAVGSRGRAGMEVGLEVLVVENPRLVEAAAERGANRTVVATNGNPTTSVVTLVGQLLASGASVAYHGDFDGAGLAICARMAELGCRPWRMGAGDYTAAVTEAEARGVTLPVDPRACGPTPWDPELAVRFNRCRSVVHEELVLEGLLGPGPLGP